MNAAVVRSTYKKADLDQVIRQYKETVLPAIASHQGGRSAIFLVDRQSGAAISFAMYEDAASAAAFAPKSKQLIDSFKQFRTSEEPKREIFEIATSTMIEAKAVVERAANAFNAHDAEAIARVTAPDAEGTAPGDVKFKGPQAGKEFNQNFINAFPDAHVEIKKTVAQGNNVVVHGVFTGTHNGTLKSPMGEIPATGKKVKGEYIQIFEVDRGLIKKADMLYDQVHLMTQLGLAPAPQQAAKPAGR
jgi:predicted ester cyclase